MKIALVSPYDYPYPGGVTEHIYHLNQEFTRRGHQVKIIAPSSTDRDELEDNVYKFGGIVSLPVSGSWARISVSLRAYPSVKRILKQEQFEVIHLHEPLMPVLPLVVLRHSKTVNVGTFHAYRPSHPGYLYGKPLLRRFVNRLNGRIAVSLVALELVSRYFPGNYTVIPNGIDYDSFAAPAVRPMSQFDDGKLNILFMGRMEKRKGFRYLLRAFPYVKQEFPQARLIVAGAYQSHEVVSFQRYLHQLRLGDVEFVGRISEEDKPRYYRTCHVFCAPSTGFESQGIVLLEAMASGKPVVATDIPGYRHVIAHGREGLLVPPQDERALAAALVHLLADRELRERMGRQGQVKAQAYSWDKVAAKILDFYQETREKKLGATKNP